jgi:hypothetical protein
MIYISLYIKLKYNGEMKALKLRNFWLNGKELLRINMLQGRKFYE